MRGVIRPLAGACGRLPGGSSHRAADIGRLRAVLARVSSVSIRRKRRKPSTESWNGRHFLRLQLNGSRLESIARPKLSSGARLALDLAVIGSSRPRSHVDSPWCRGRRVVFRTICSLYEIRLLWSQVVCLLRTVVCLLEGTVSTRMDADSTRMDAVSHLREVIRSCSRLNWTSSTLVCRSYRIRYRRREVDRLIEVVKPPSPRVTCAAHRVIRTR